MNLIILTSCLFNIYQFEAVAYINTWLTLTSFNQVCPVAIWYILNLFNLKTEFSYFIQNSLFSMTFWNKNMTYHESYSSSNINILIICIRDLKIDIVINFYITEKEGDLQLFISGSNIDGYSSQIIYIYTPAPRRGRGVYCFTSVRPSVLPSVQDIFLSNCWWQKSDIWSQASYRYTILWEAFLDPSDSYFLFANLVVFLYTLNIYAHFSSHFSQQLLMAEIWYLVTSFI